MAEFDLNDPRLTAFALGELPEQERLEVERWLEESAEARAALVEIQETIDLVKDELAAEPVPTLTSTQRQAIEAQLSASQSAAAGNPVTLAIDGASDRGSLSWRWLSLGLTAAALVGIALVLPRDAQRDVANLPAASNQTGDFGSQVAMTEPQPIAAEGVVLDEASAASVPLDALVVREKAAAFDAPDSEAKSADKRLAQRRMTVAATEESKTQVPHSVALNRRESVGNESSRQQQQLAQSEPRDRSREMQRKGDVASSTPELGRSLDSQPGASAPAAGLAPLSAPFGAGGNAGGSVGSGAGVPPVGLKSDLAKSKPVASSTPTNGERMRALNESKKAVDRFEDESRAKDGKPATQPQNAVVAVSKKMNAPAPGAAPSAEGAKPAAAPDGNLAAGMAAGPAEKAGKPVTRTASVANKEVAELRDAQLAARTKVKQSGEGREESERIFSFYVGLDRGGDGEKNAEAYEPITENEFVVPQDSPLSTFSIDVDSASYANMRRFLNQGQLPPANAIRVEELINYFSYQYAQPADGQPFSVLADAAPCPWSKDHYIARIGLKARDIDKAKRPPTNLVFLIDVSGSMGTPNKLPLVKRGMSLLVEEMTETDRISIVTYAGDAGLKLEPTTGNEQARIMSVIDGLNAGGSTNGAAGINLAYEQALRHFNKEAANRVILCTDGDFNVGVSSDSELVKLIEAQAKTGVYLSIFGFGMGNLKDSKLEKLADKGNGHYGYIDDLNEARKVFNEELVGTLYTVAKDVKLQVEFNPLTVGAYRLIGYENRTLAAQDFNDDTKDAGEIGAGHTVTALYEIVPVGKWPQRSNVDPLKYAAADKAADRKLSEAKDAAKKVPADVADDLFTVKLRYKQPNAETSVKTIDYVVDDIAGKKVVPNGDLMWAASVANFGMQLRHSKHAGQWKLEDIAETASGLVGDDRTGRRNEFVDLVKKAAELSPR